MKKLLGALAIALFAQNTAALTISAKLTGFESVPQTIQGLATGGGRGTFEVVGVSGAVPDPFAGLFADGKFQALCLEPDSFVSTGVTYDFLVTPLANAPTSGVPGGMGVVREGLVENALGRQGMTTVEALSVAGVAAATALVYEAGYESAVNALNLTSGDVVVTGSGAANAQASLSGPILTNVETLALLNVGITNSFGVRTVYEAQDFFVTTTVPSPGALALLGIGMLGLVGFRKVS